MSANRGSSSLLGGAGATIGILVLLIVVIFLLIDFRLWARKKRRGGKAEPVEAVAVKDIATHSNAELHASRTATAWIGLTLVMNRE